VLLELPWPRREIEKVIGNNYNYNNNKKEKKRGEKKRRKYSSVSRCLSIYAPSIEDTRKISRR
jgi:hypothetical protein